MDNDLAEFQRSMLNEKANPGAGAVAQQVKALA